MVEETLGCSAYAEREHCGRRIVEPGWYFGNDKGVDGCVKLESAVSGIIGHKREGVSNEKGVRNST